MMTYDNTGTDNSGSAGADDVELAARFAAGDDAAFDALYRRYVRPIHDYLTGIVRNRATAEDLTQTVFMRVYEQRTALRDPAAFRGWLYRIAHNTAVNQASRAAHMEPIDPQGPYAAAEPGPEQLASQDETSQLVWDAAASLEPNQFAVLDLALRKGLSSGEIAGVLGLTSAQASLALHRSREALGNAVRFLVVARRRRHCDRLAEMVPSGVRSLTPDQRASVDRHVRRCANCQRAAAALTRPAEMFGVIPLVAVPSGLLTARAAESIAAAHAATAHAAAAHAAAAHATAPPPATEHPVSAQAGTTHTGTTHTATTHTATTHTATRASAHMSRRLLLRHHWLAAISATAITAGAITIGVVATEHTVSAPTTRHFQLAGAFSEPAGYSYRVSAAVTLGMPSTSSPAAVPPHDALISMTISGQITITNTTPGHDAPDPLGIAAVDVDALYRFPSPICPGPDLLGHPIEAPGLEGALRTYIGRTGYCLLTLTSLNGLPPSSIAPGHSLTVAITGGECGSNDATILNACPPNSPGPHVITELYTRAHAAAAQRALAGLPDYVTISPLDLGAAPAHSCTLSSDGSQGWVMASDRPVVGQCR